MTAPDDAAAGLPALRFLEGRWISRDEGQLQVETWAAPAADTMVGTFLWAGADGGVRMLELMTIAAEAAPGAGGGDGPAGATGSDAAKAPRTPVVTLRIRHFNAALVAREEKDAPLVLVLASASGGPEGGNARFELKSGSPSLTAIHYERRANALKATLSFTEASGRAPICIRFTAAT